MDEISAQFSSRCAKCRGPIVEGERIMYDRPNRKGYHVRCAPEPPRDLFEDQVAPPDAKTLEVADRCGFRPHSEFIVEGPDD